MDDQFLYRYFDGTGAALYNGRSNDWTRRLREHWRGDYWSGDIVSVTVERHPDLSSVVAAEAASIRAEHPRYNVQHNRPGMASADVGAGREWTTEDVVLMIGLAVLVIYVVYKGTVVAVEKYGQWKAERDEFRSWKQARADATTAERTATGDEPVTSTEPALVAASQLAVAATAQPVLASPEPNTVIIPKSAARTAVCPP